MIGSIARLMIFIAALKLLSSCRPLA